MSIKKMDLTEFWEDGFLQEANRQFFHPLGLALEVAIAADGSATLGGVRDYREDIEGMILGHRPDATKAENVAAEAERHREERMRLMGAVVQPLDWDPPELDGLG